MKPFATLIGAQRFAEDHAVGPVGVLVTLPAKVKGKMRLVTYGITFQLIRDQWSLVTKVGRSAQ
jgi:hypothetical protein